MSFFLFAKYPFKRWFFGRGCYEKNGIDGRNHPFDIFGPKKNVAKGLYNNVRKRRSLKNFFGFFQIKNYIMCQKGVVGTIYRKIFSKFPPAAKILKKL